MNNKKIEQLNIPKHVAIIMDGNRTWAKKRGLPSKFGHNKGAKTLKEMVFYANKIGVKYLTVYAFSTENWSRSKEEVDYLMKLPMDFLDDNERLLMEKDIKFTWVGNSDRLEDKIISKINEFEEKSKNNQGLNFVIAFNYGGRDEIVKAVNKALDDKIENIDEEKFEKYLSSSVIPDVDLMIRTSGQLRISNFLLWKLAYSEFYFSDVLWPNFNEKEFNKAIREFNLRNRSYGGNK